MFAASKMHLATFFIVIAMTTINGNDISSRNAIARTADQNLMQFMVRSGALSQSNPTRSLGCFEYYVPVLNAITNEYEHSYAACLASADERREAIDNSTQAERDGIESSAQDACNALSACSENSNSISYFECYVGAGSDNTKVMYAISANSSVILAEIREEYRLVENEENRCTNSSERAYVESTAQTYEELQACLQGKIPVPTTTTTEVPSSTTSTTTTASTTITTSSAPAETTTDESTAETEEPENPTINDYFAVDDEDDDVNWR